jgi:hypothetical protein
LADALVLPYSQFIPWIIEHHALNMPLFMHDLFANRISAFFALDVIVSAIVLLSFIQSEGRRLRMRFLWFADVGYSVRRSFARSAAFSLFAATRARSEGHLNLRQ